MNDVMHRKRARRIWRFEKSQGVEFLPPKKKVDFWSSLRPCGGCREWRGGAVGKVVIERLCLSLPYVEKLFNSKVIKSFVPELRNRKFFCVSGFLCYLYMDIINVLRTGMNMSISLIYIWLCYTMVLARQRNWLVILFYGVSTLSGHLTPN